jgi:hypothetical protein
MFSVITNIYNKKTKGPTLMELFTTTGKVKKFFFWQLEVFDVCTMGDMAHINKIFKLFFLLYMFVIKENIMKRPACESNITLNNCIIIY